MPDEANKPKSDPLARAAVLAKYDQEDVEFVRQQLQMNLEESPTDLSGLLGMRALGADDETVEGALDIGAQFLRQGMPDQAFQYLTGLAQYDPLNWRVHQLLAMAEHARKHYALAEQLYRMSITFHDPDGLSHLYLGECLLHLGKQEEALVEVRRSIELLRADVHLKPYLQRAEKVLSMQEAMQEAKK